MDVLCLVFVQIGPFLFCGSVSFEHYLNSMHNHHPASVHGAAPRAHHTLAGTPRGPEVGKPAGIGAARTQPPFPRVGPAHTVLSHAGRHDHSKNTTRSHYSDHTSPHTHARPPALFSCVQIQIRFRSPRLARRRSARSAGTPARSRAGRVSEAGSRGTARRARVRTWPGWEHL